LPPLVVSGRFIAFGAFAVVDDLTYGSVKTTSTPLSVVVVGMFLLKEMGKRCRGVILGQKLT